MKKTILENDIDKKSLSKQNVGLRIYQLMQARNISVEEIKDLLDLSSRAVYLWLEGKRLPTLDNVYALSRILGVTMDEIVVGERTDNCPKTYLINNTDK
jgi:transcriptional regulator with XRE-family HTH domain